LTPFPPQLSAPVRAWRIDQKKHAAAWASGMGAHGSGGRWNPRGVKAVYCSLDAATAIIEVAVHKGFRALDVVPHVSTVLEIQDPTHVHVVMPSDVPNPAWLLPGIPGVHQQAFGASLMATLIFDPDRTAGLYTQALQEQLAIDTCLNPPSP
jgi:RES domain-containing protein